MSSCYGSLCLLVVLGAVLASGNPCRFVADNLHRSHNSIADVLKLKEPEIGSNPIFSSVIQIINTSCQTKVSVMNATLDIYTRIFSSILQDNHHQALLEQLTEKEKSQVKSSVKDLQQKMETLKKHLNHLNHNREDLLSKLNEIEVDDPLVQKKALAQFLEVYQAASVIGSRRCGHSAERR